MSVRQDLPLDAVRTAGPLLVGYLLNWGLYGVLSVQVCIYYAAFPDDKTGTKSLVYGTYILETIQTVLVTHDAFHALVIGFGNLDCLTRTNFTWLTAGVMAGLIACIVQIFYAYRIYVFSKSKIMAAFITLMALTQCSAGIVAGSLAAVVSNWTMLTFKSVRIASGIWTALSRRKSILKSTQTLLTRIIKLVIGTGIFTALVAILSLVLFEATHLRGALFSTPGLILAKFYSNSMMVILNSRFEIVGGRYSVPPSEISLPSNIFLSNSDSTTPSLVLSAS